MLLTYQKSALVGQISSENTAEYLLSDYQGDIKKVLLTQARAVPSGMFISEGEVQLSGCIAYDVLYADVEGRLTSARFSSDYELTAPAAAWASEGTPCVRVTGVTVRLSGPRKITARCTVGAHVTVVGEQSLETDGSAMAEEEQAELRTECHEVRRTELLPDAEASYADTVPIEGGGAQAELVFHGAQVTVRDIAVQDGALTFVADVQMHAIVTGEEGGVPTCHRRTLTINERHPWPVTEPCMQPLVEAVVTGVEGEMLSDADGMCEARLSADVTYRMRAEGNVPLSVVTDGYLLQCATRESYEELSLERYIDTVYTTVPFEGTLARDESECEGLREILYTAGGLRGLHASVGDDGTLSLEGEVQATAIGISSDEGGRVRFCPLRQTVPFSQSVRTASALPAGAHADAEGTVVTITATQDASGIYFSGTCLVRTLVTAQRACRRLSRLDALPDEPTVRTSSVITVYYPSEGETLWDIARTYHTTTDALLRDNGMDAAAVSDGALPPQTGHLLIL